MSRSLRCRAAAALALAGAAAIGIALLPSRAVGAHGSHPPGQYVVVFKESVADPAAAARQMANQHRLTLGPVYRSALKGFGAVIPPARLEAVARDPRVGYIEPDQIYRTTAAFPIPTGVDRVDADASATAKIDGANDALNVNVAILDTGIQTNHPDLNVVGGRNFATFRGSDTKYNDGNGHGTHVAGIVAARDNGVNSGSTHVVGVAPGARLWAVKVLGNDGSGFTSWVIAGIDWVTQNAGTIKVANMSLGGGNSQAMKDALDRSVAAGVTYAVAAGNSNADCQNTSPANSTNPGVITVSAFADYNGEGGGGAAATTSYGADDTFATFSNYGTGADGVDIAAPGVDILSTWRSSGYRRLSGTSMAAPHVAGAAALRILTSGGSPLDVRNTLLAAAKPAADPNFGYTGGSKDGVDEPVLYAGAF